MKLNIFKRQGNTKGAVNKVRRDGQIPAIIYIKNQAGEQVALNSNEFNAVLRTIRKGSLSTSIFTLVDENGKQRRAIVKEIQYMPTTYDVIHLDFEELVDSVPVSVKVPVECIGVVDCQGVKLGGVLRQVLRHVKVKCLPKDIPSFFELDVKDLGLFESKRVSDMNLPSSVKPLTKLSEVAAIVVKR